MNLIRPLAAVLALLCTVPAQAQAQADPQKPQRVRIHFPSHLPPSTDSEQTYAATCKDVAYRLVVTPVSKSVILKRSTMGDVDLSDTAMGRQLLDRDVVTTVGFNCPIQALNIFLQGFITEDGQMPKAYRVDTSVRHDGTVRSDRGMYIVPLDEFGSPRELRQNAAPATN